MSYSNKVLRLLNELKLSNKKLELENLKDYEVDELKELGFNVVVKNNKYLILEN